LIHSRQRTEPRITRSGRAGTAITGAGSGPSAAPAAGSALHLAAAVAPAAHAAAVAGVAPVGDPLPEGAGAAAAEAAAVSVTRRAGLHGLTTFRSCRGAVTGHTQCDMRYPGPRWRGTILDARAVRAAGAGPTATSGRRPRRDRSCRCRCRRRTWSSPTCPSGRCPCTRDTTRCPYRQGTASSAWVIPSRTDRCVHVTRLPERVRRPSPNVNVDRQFAVETSDDGTGRAPAARAAAIPLTPASPSTLDQVLKDPSTVPTLTRSPDGAGSSARRG